MPRYPIQIEDLTDSVSVPKSKQMEASMKLAEIKAGDTIIVDGGFTCMRQGPHTVEADAKGVFVKCDDGKHYLEGQEDEEGAELVGVSRPPR